MIEKTWIDVGFGDAEVRVGIIFELWKRGCDNYHASV